MPYSLAALSLALLTLLTFTTGCSDDTASPPSPDARYAALDGAPDTASADMSASDAVKSDAPTSDAAPSDAPSPDATPTKETKCDDGLDNDGDTKADCLDPDCDKQRCRVTVGYCDAEETCSNSACPADGAKAKGEVCRKGDSCDVEEKCDGVSKHCPADKLALSTLVCRAPSGPCDYAETCDGVLPTCPADVLELKGVICRAAAGSCDEAEQCDGTTDACPADKLVPASAKKVCRAKAGVCDAEELCDGSLATCPAEAFLGPGAPTCRPSAGACDFAESCDGKGASCPVDVNGCKAGEYCSSGACLTKLAKGTACTSGVECVSGFCEDKVCCDKSCGAACSSCALAGSVGTCTNHAKGSDPEKGCGKYVCDGVGACYSYCIDKKGIGYCNPSYFCAYGECRLKYFNKTECKNSSEYMCMSGFCWIPPGKSYGNCCDPGCNRCCGDCSSGKCKPAPANKDASGCGSYFSCDGKGGYNTACTADAFNCSANCSSIAWCWQGKCGADLAAGAACVGACQCKSNACFPFVCW